MPMPEFVEVTLQAALMNVLSNVLAQYIQSLKEGVSLVALSGVTHAG